MQRPLEGVFDIDRFHDLGVAFDRNYRCPLSQTVAAFGGDGKHLSFVGQFHSNGERSVVLQFDRAPAQ